MEKYEFIINSLVNQKTQKMNRLIKHKGNLSLIKDSNRFDNKKSF